MLYNIEIHADTVCPWSYLDRKSLSQATVSFRKTNPDAEFRIVWKPFFLLPKLANAKQPKRRFYEALSLFCYRSFTTLFGRIEDAVDSLGDCSVDFSGTIGPSRDSHRLLALALRRRGPSFQTRLADAIFSANFEQGADISDADTLARIVLGVNEDVEQTEQTEQTEQDDDDNHHHNYHRHVDNDDNKSPSLLGRDPNPVLKWLRDSNAGTDEVVEQALRATLDYGIDAVPTVTVQGKYRVGGYQTPDVFVSLFERIRREST